MSVPAKTSFKTTSFGVRTRELIISGAAGFTGLALLALPLGSIFVRILLAAGVAAAGVLYAFWKVGRIWTVEAYWSHRLSFGRRPRRYLKGVGANQAFDPPGRFGGNGSGPAQPAAVAPRVPPAATAPEPDQPLFWLPEVLSPQSNAELVGLVLAFFAVAVFLAWIAATGGVGEIQTQLRVLWSAFWRDPSFYR